METMKQLVNQIAYTPLSYKTLSKLSPLQKSLIPLLSLVSSLYRAALSFRHHLYYLGCIQTHRLPVPVISVGNLSWGGNGKTPMVELIALWFSEAGISPLILTRGYAGGDEAKMLKRHLSTTRAKIGVGANRAATAACFFEKYGHEDPCGSTRFKRLCADHKEELISHVEKIGVVILDDGMQVTDRELKLIKLKIREMNETLPIFLTRLSPSSFFNIKSCDSKFPLLIMQNMVVLCVSAIGSANAFVQSIEKLGPLHVDRLDFSDHHSFQPKDIEMIKKRLRDLQDEFGDEPVVVVTEKDYDRGPTILRELGPFEVLVLCSHLQIIPSLENAEKNFKKLVKLHLEVSHSAR